MNITQKSHDGNGTVYTHMMPRFGPSIHMFEYETRSVVDVFRHGVQLANVSADVKADGSQVVKFEFTCANSSVLTVTLHSDDDLLDSLSAKICGEQWLASTASESWNDHE